METHIDTSNIIDLIQSLWSLPGPVGPIVTTAALTVLVVSLTRHKLAEWFPWFATRHGALALVWGCAFLGALVTAAQAGEVSLLPLLTQAVAAAFTATGIRSQSKAVSTGGAPT